MTLLANLMAIAIMTGSATAQETQLVVQIGHTSSVVSIDFDTTGRWLASASADNTIKVWDVESGALIRTLEGHQRGVTSVAFSPDGELIASGSRDATVRIWSARTGSVIHQLPRHAAAIRCVAFSPSGRFLAAAGDDGAVRVYDVRTGQWKEAKGHRRSVSAVSYGSTDSMFATGGMDGRLILWHMRDSLSYQEIHAGGDWVNCVAFSADGHTLASGSEDHGISLWNVESRRITRTLKEHVGAIASISFSRDGRTLLSGSKDRTVKLWSADSDKSLRTFPNQVEALNSIRFFPSGAAFGVAGSEASIRLVDVESSRTLREFAGRSNRIRSIAFSPDGKLLASGGNDTTIRLWNVARGDALHALKGHRGAVTSLSFHSQNILASASDDSTVRVWDVDSRAESTTLSGHSSHVYSVVVSPDGYHIVSGGADNTIRLWDIASRQSRVLNDRETSIYALGFSRNGEFIVAAGADRVVELVDVQGQQSPRAIASSTGELYALAVDPSGSLIASGGADHGVLVTKISDGHGRGRVLQGHSELVSAVTFDSEGHLIASGSADHTVRIWDVASGKSVQTLRGHAGRVQSVAFSPDGTLLASGSSDATIKLWDTRTWRYIATLITVGDSNWVVVDSAGRFDASSDAESFIHWVVEMEVISFDQLRDRYYEPGLLGKIFGYSPDPVIAVPPLNRIELFPELNVSFIDSSNQLLRVLVKNRGGGIGRIAVFINHTEVMADARPAGLDADADSAVIHLDLGGDTRFISGKANVVTVQSYNASEYLCSRGVDVTFNDTHDTVIPRLWAIVAGVSTYRDPSLNLRFAAQDAVAIATALELGGRRHFGADRTHITLLSTDSGHGRPTRESIMSSLDSIARHAMSSDIVVLYLSGHGVARGGSTGDFYYLTQDAVSGAVMDPVVRGRAISFSELTEIFKKIPALKRVVILDACGAGKAVDMLSSMRDPLPSSTLRSFDRMNRRTGTYLLAGCASDAVSYEASRYGQGLLTYCLLKAMVNQELLREGEFIDVRSLFEAAIDEVPRLAEGISGVQRPQVAAPPVDNGSFDIGRLTSSDRKLIPIKPVRPVFMRSRIQEEISFDDVREIGVKLDSALREISQAKGLAPMLYVDATDYPGGYRVVGRYTLSSDSIKFRGRIVLEQKSFYEFDLQAETADELVDDLLKKIDMAIATISK